MTGTSILVGYDGSQGAMAALAWGLDEGVRRGLPVRIIHVRGASPAPDEAGALGPDADVTLKRLAAEAEDWGTLGIPVTATVLDGCVAEVLCERTREASMLVVGDRGGGGFAGLRVGSVTSTVVAYAHCPVVVVRDGRYVRSTRPVAAGLDRSPQSELALRHAFAAAAGRDVGLIVVRACVPTGEARVTEQKLVEEQIAVSHDRYPSVSATTRLTRAKPGHALTIASHDAQLLVVGARGSGGFAELALGSVAAQLLQHSLCPVMVVRGGIEPPAVIHG